MIKGKTSQAKKQRSRLRGEISRGEAKVSKVGLGKLVKKSKLPSLEDFKGLPFTKGEDRVINILWSTYSALKSQDRDLKNLLDGGKVPQRVRVKPKAKPKANPKDEKSYNMTIDLSTRPYLQVANIKGILKEAGKDLKVLLKGATTLTGSLEGLRADLFAGIAPLMMGDGGRGESKIHEDLKAYHTALYTACHRNRGDFLYNPVEGSSQTLELVNEFLGNTKGTCDNSLNDFLNEITTSMEALKALSEEAKKIRPGHLTVPPKYAEVMVREGIKFVHEAPEVASNGWVVEIIREGTGNLEITTEHRKVIINLGTKEMRYAELRMYLLPYGVSPILLILEGSEGTELVSTGKYELTGGAEEVTKTPLIVKTFVKKVLSKNEKIIEGIHEILLNLRDEGILRDLAYNYSDRKVAFKDVWAQVKEGDITYAKFKYLREALVAAQKNFTQGAENIYSPVTLRQSYLVTRVYNQLRRVAYYTTLKDDTQKAIAEAFKEATKSWYEKAMADKETENARFSVEYKLLNDPQNLADFVLEVLNNIVINEEYLKVDVVNFQETLEDILSGAGGPITHFLWKYLQEQDISRSQRLQNPSADESLSKEELLSQLSKEEVRKSGFVLRKLAPWMVARMRSTRGESKPGDVVKTLRRLEDLTKVESSKEVLEILGVMAEYLKSKDSKDKIQKIIINFEKNILPEVLDESPWLIDEFGETDLYYELFGLDKPIPKKLSVDVTDHKNEVEFSENLTKGEIDKILEKKHFLKPYRDILVSFFTGNSKKDKVTYLLALAAMNSKSTSESLEKLHKKLMDKESDKELKKDVTRRRGELSRKLEMTDERDFYEDPEGLKRYLDLLHASASAYKGDGKRIDPIKPFLEYKASMGKRKGTKPAVYSSLAGDYDISVPKHIPTYALRATKVYNYIRFYGNVKSIRDKVTDYRNKYTEYVKAVEDLVESAITHEGLPRELKTEKGVYVPLLGVALGEYPWINLPQTPKKNFRGKRVGFDTWVFETIVKEALLKFDSIFKPRPLEVNKRAVTLITGSSLPLRLKRDGNIYELELRSPVVNFFYSSLIVAFGGTPIYLGGEFRDIPTTSTTLTEVKILGGEFRDIPTTSTTLTEVKILNEGWKAINRLVKDLRLVGESTLSRLELSRPNGRKEIYGKELLPYLPYFRTQKAPTPEDKLLEEIEAEMAKKSKKSNPQEGSWFDLPLADAWEEATSLESFNLAQILAVMCTVLSFTTHMYADLVTPLLLDHKESPVFTSKWLTKKLMPTTQLSELLNFIEIGADNGVLLLCARRIFAQHSPRDVNMLITLARFVSCVPGIFDGRTLETLGVSIFSMLPPKAKKMSITELLESQHGPKRLPECESVEPMKAGVWIDPGNEVVYQKIQGFWFAYPKSSSEPSKVYQEHAKRWRRINPKDVNNATNEGTTWYMKVPTKLLKFIDTLPEAEVPNFIHDYFEWPKPQIKVHS